MFNSVISQSGSILNPWSIEYKPKEMAFKLGETLGIRTQDTGELVNKLAEFSAGDIIIATKQMMNDIVIILLLIKISKKICIIIFI